MPIITAQGMGKSDGRAFKTLPTDTYPMRVDSVDVKESNGEKTAGQSMLELQLVVVGGHENAGAKVWNYSMLPHEDCSETQNSQRAAGLAMIQIAAGLDRTDELDTDDLMGCEVTVDVKEVPRKGSPGEFQNSVSKIHASG